MYGRVLSNSLNAPAQCQSCHYPIADSELRIRDGGLDICRCEYQTLQGATPTQHHLQEFIFPNRTDWLLDTGVWTTFYWRRSSHYLHGFDENTIRVQLCGASA